MSQDTRIGTTIAGYRIERLLGRGGMGRVYLAEDSRLGRKVALKLLDPELATDERFRDRFVRESRLAASLDHPNMVPIYEAGESGGVLFIAMRYVKGTDLRALIDSEGRLPLERTSSIVSQVASALDAAHAEGLIHRDVKPANVLLVPGAPDRVYLADFGLTKRAASDSGVTGTGQFVGTLDYAAPEQFTGEPLTPATDVYSLGCVLYECLTGEVPFPRDREAAVLHAHLNEPPPKISDKRPELPAAIDSVVAKAMAKRPQNRYRTAGAVSADAGDALRSASPVKRSGSRSSILVALLVLAAVVVGVVALSSHPGDKGRPTSANDGRVTSPAPPSPTIRFGSGLVAVDPKTGKVIQEVPGPGAAAVGEGGVWALRSTAVARVDRGTGAVKLIGLPFVVRSLAVGQGAIWVEGGNGQAFGSQVARIDPATDQVIKPLISIPSSITLSSIATAPGAVWVSDTDGRLTLIDPGSDRIVSQTKPLGGADELVYGAGSLWILDKLDGLIAQADPRTGKILAKIPVSGDANAFTVAFDALWVVDSQGGTVTKIDPTTRKGHDARVGLTPYGVTSGFGAIWVANRGDGTLTRIDPATLESKDYALGGPLVSVTADRPAKLLWVGVAAQCEGC